MNKLFSALTLATLLSLGVATQIQAQSESTVTNTQTTTTGNSRPVTAPLRQQIQNRVENRVDDRCDRVENRLDAIMSHYDVNKDRHLETYKQLKTDFANLMRLLSSKEYDVTKLQADAKVLDEKIVKFGRDYEAYVTQIEKTKEFACGESAGNFVSELEKVHQLLRVVRADVQDIRQYYLTTIKADIQAVRQQKLTTNQNATP